MRTCRKETGDISRLQKRFFLVYSREMVVDNRENINHGKYVSTYNMRGTSTNIVVVSVYERLVSTNICAGKGRVLMH
jgi:hypothetical protein